MSVAVIIESVEEVKPLLGLAYQMANAENNDLYVFIMRRVRKDETEVKEINLQDYAEQEGIRGQTYSFLKKKSKEL